MNTVFNKKKTAKLGESLDAFSPAARLRRRKSVSSVQQRGGGVGGGRRLRRWRGRNDSFRRLRGIASAASVIVVSTTNQQPEWACMMMSMIPAVCARLIPCRPEEKWG